MIIRIINKEDKTEAIETLRIIYQPSSVMYSIQNYFIDTNTCKQKDQTTVKTSILSRLHMVVVNNIN